MAPFQETAQDTHELDGLMFIGLQGTARKGARDSTCHARVYQQITMCDFTRLTRKSVASPNKNAVCTTVLHVLRNLVINEASS